MEKEQIEILMREGKFPDPDGHAELIETHISWILFGKLYAYKIKKPLLYSFLDFSSLEKRKYYCEREIELNKRLSEGIYLDVQSVRITAGRYTIGNEPGEIVDYAVRMMKMDREKQMDYLLIHNRVSPADLLKLADKIALFHRKAEIIHQKDLLDIPIKFKDLEGEMDFLEKARQPERCRMIDQAVRNSDKFINRNMKLMQQRLESGFIRDGHGDLHTRNIFLLPDPQPFDCIEFNDDYRQIDVLNEVAFLCMDLDAFGRNDLSELFIRYYNQLFTTMKTAEDHQLFIYFKSYRANIRAKVNSLRARSSKSPSEINKYLGETDRYLRLMDHYMNMLSIH
jgi:uncharacterized protein